MSNMAVRVFLFFSHNISLVFSVSHSVLSVINE